MLINKWADLISLRADFERVLGDLEVRVSSRHRFDAAFDRAQELEDARVAGTMDSITGTRMGEMRFAMRDLGDVQKILEGIKLYTGDRSILATKLGRMLEGSYSPIEEASKNAGSEPRNVQFELVLLSGLLKAGLKAYLCDPNPDIEVLVFGRVYAIECKRLFSDSDHSVQDNVGAALKQLLKSIGDDQRKRGIVALAIERRFTGGDKILEAQNERVARKRLEADIGQFIYKYCHRWTGQKIKSPRQVAVMVFVGVSGRLLDDGIMVNITQLDATNTSSLEGIYARSLFEDFKGDILEPLKLQADATRGRFLV